MAKIVGIGACTADLLFTVPAFPREDTKTRASSFLRAGGGPVATGLCAARKLGESASFIGLLADDPEGAFLKNYEFDKPTGYGIQQVYSADRVIDEAFTTRNGDLVEIPKAYHPGTVAPGYTGYLLWLMSCDKRALISSADPEQVWQNQ